MKLAVNTIIMSITMTVAVNMSIIITTAAAVAKNMMKKANFYR